jgi:hypothetical protein
MKKVVFFAMMSAFALAASAFTPNTKWPYMMEQFQEGTLYRGKDYSVAQFNIHYKGNVLHYINPKDDKIYEAKQNDMDSVVIAGKKFVKADGKVMEVVAQKDANLVLKYDFADFSQLNRATGAYGSSANSSATRQLSSIDMAGLDNPKHGLLLQEKNDGSELYIRTKYFLRVGNVVVEADKKDIEKMLPDSQKDAWKQFLKKNKIKWKNEDSLVLVLSFF